MTSTAKLFFADDENGAAESGLNSCLQRSGKDPKDLTCRLSFAEQAEKSNSFRVAAVEYLICTHIHDSAETYYKLGRCLLKAGALTSGYAALKMAIGRTWSKEEQADRVACQRLLDEAEGKTTRPTVE